MVIKKKDVYFIGYLGLELCLHQFFPCCWYIYSKTIWIHLCDRRVTFRGLYAIACWYYCCALSQKCIRSRTTSGLLSPVSRCHPHRVPRLPTPLSPWNCNPRVFDARIIILFIISGHRPWYSETADCKSAVTELFAKPQRDISHAVDMTSTMKT